MDVMFYEAFAEEEDVLRALLPPTLKAGFTAATIQAEPADVPPATVVSIRTQSLIPSSWAQVLRGVLSRSAGFDHLVRFRRETGSTAACGYLQNYCARAVAEHAVLTMMALFRKLPQQQKQMATFDRDGLTGKECRGRRALVVGVGHIGSEIVEIARALGMMVRGVDIVIRRKDVEYVSLKEGALWADVIFCALPLTAMTQGLIAKELFAQRVIPVFIVNIARGEVTPAADMIALMEQKKLAGLACDVYPQEERFAEALRSGLPVSADLARLMSMPNVIGTPHNAFNTEEALLEKCRQTISSLECFFSAGRFPRGVGEKV